MTFSSLRAPAVLLGLGLLTLPAAAHISFETPVVAAGKTAKFVLRVPHGCGDRPTTGIRLQIPKGLESVKPQPKAGWTLELVPEAHTDAAGAAAHSGGHGSAAAISEIAWTGGRLEDAWYDEFAFRATVAKGTTGRLFVPVVQQCDGGVERWIEVPAAGGSSDDLKFPAPSVRVEP